MPVDEKNGGRSSVRQRINKIKGYRCKNLIAVIENPRDILNIGAVIRNVEALCGEDLYR
jgi:tRNA (guanosine-2'-O-)-methyltransferase